MSTTEPRFAFLSKDGILHLHDKEHAARHGKYVQTSLTDDKLIQSTHSYRVRRENGEIDTPMVSISHIPVINDAEKGWIKC